MVDIYRPKLTPREIEVLRLVTQGKSTEGIAQQIRVSPETVSRFLYHANLKLGTHSRRDAANKLGHGDNPNPTADKLRLTPREKEVLQLTAAGKSIREIANDLSTLPGTIVSFTVNISERLGTKSQLQSVVVGIEEGLVDLDQATSGFNPTKISLLAPRELQVLAIAAADRGINSTEKEIAGMAGITKNTVNSYFRNIYAKMGVRGKIQAVVSYLASQRAPINPSP